MLPAIAATTVNPSQMSRMVENGIMAFTVTSLAWPHRWRPVPAEGPVVLVEAVINAILPDNPGADASRRAQESRHARHHGVPRAS
jgi:hypothetical protein